ncbi:hypothetical protein, partial [Escherichia coli]|uniref:hypothetical protein n=1 Tax=Escherichia coli TaxID=562 RepID=UPI000934ACC7
ECAAAGVWTGVKYQEISINKITLVNVARVIPPDFISKLFSCRLLSDPKAKTRLVGGFLRISGAGLGIEGCFYHVEIG